MNERTLDYIIGAGGATAPAWLQWVHMVSDMAAAVAAIGGVMLVSLRIALAIREWKNKVH
jgi:hypothetical protein